MNNTGVAIKYGDFAPEAKENFFASADSEFDTLHQLREYNLSFPNFANPCEGYSVVLDGTASAIPSDTSGANLGFWSIDVSDENGDFEIPIILELTSEYQYSSQGLTLTFDTYNGTFPARMTVEWMRDNEVISSKEFHPDNSLYFCQNFVQNYNRIIITFHSLNMPKNRLKLRSIDYGYGAFFYGDELRNVKATQEIDPISSEISINTVDFTLDSKSDIQYSFQSKQPLQVYFNGELKAVTFVKSSKRKASFLWDVQSEDYIGTMDGAPYAGGIYTDARVGDILADIFAVAKVPYSVTAEIEEKMVSGYVPYSTCREALMQVAFAVQAVVDTSDSEVVQIKELSDEVKQTVPLDRIMQGQNFDSEEAITGVEVTYHSFAPARRAVYAYDARESGTGENIFVSFSEPLRNLRMGFITEIESGEMFEEDVRAGEVVEFGANYAIINAKENGVLRGVGYEHSMQIKRKDNPIFAAGSAEKIASIQDATLVSASNVDSVLDKCYNWLIKSQKTNLKIVEGKHVVYGEKIKYGEKKYGTFKYGGKYPNIVTYDPKVSVGDVIRAETEYLGTVEGRITSQTFNLNGNIIIKEAEMR